MGVALPRPFWLSDMLSKIYKINFDDFQHDEIRIMQKYWTVFLQIFCAKKGRGPATPLWDVKYARKISHISLFHHLFNSKGMKQ